jgi:hypothetical protein
VKNRLLKFLSDFSSVRAFPPNRKYSFGYEQSYVEDSDVSCGGTLSHDEDEKSGCAAVRGFPKKSRVAFVR